MASSLAGNVSSSSRVNGGLGSRIQQNFWSALVEVGNKTIAINVDQSRSKHSCLLLVFRLLKPSVLVEIRSNAKRSFSRKLIKRSKIKDPSKADNDWHHPQFQGLLPLVYHSVISSVSFRYDDVIGFFSWRFSVVCHMTVHDSNVASKSCSRKCLARSFHYNSVSFSLRFTIRLYHLHTKHQCVFVRMTDPWM